MIGSQEPTSHGLAVLMIGGVPATHFALALHVSAPLQALPSEHEVPAERGVCVTPVAGLHESAVHGLPSSMTGAVPATHVALALHVDAPVQTLPAEQVVPTGAGVWVIPDVGLHESTVHAFPSSTDGSAPAVQAPVALHVSAPLHTFPSEQDVPEATGVCMTPLNGLHESAVHTFPSSRTGGVPAVQVPAALHVSAPLQAFPSEHDVPPATGVWVTPVAALHASIVQGFPSSMTGGAPVATHVALAVHVDAPLHAFAPAQDVPTGAGVCVAPPCVPHASVVQALLSDSVTLPNSRRAVTAVLQFGMSGSMWSSKCEAVSLVPARGAS